ncbi:hypothetical protein KAT63_04070 [Candidatus Parcubacteria bacterium]|nr:hypothetical protein [Candidatus Parcubacteria bacterium]
MSKKDFNRKQCIKALKKIGFQKKNNRRGNHDKFVAPQCFLNNNSESPPFIVVPRSRQMHCQFAILQELKIMGGNNLVEKFLKNI